jgi:hypothetical protein
MKWLFAAAMMLATSGCATFVDLQSPLTKEKVDSDEREYTINEFVAKYGKPPVVRIEDDQKHLHLIYPQVPMSLYSMKNRAGSCVDVHFKDEGQGFYLFSTMDQTCSGATRSHDDVEISAFESKYLDSRKPASLKKAKKKKKPKKKSSKKAL